MVFDSKDEAIAFAKSNGMKYELRSPVSTETVPVGTMAYADNFLPRQVLYFGAVQFLKLLLLSGHE